MTGKLILCILGGILLSAGTYWRIFRRFPRNSSHIFILPVLRSITYTLILWLLLEGWTRAQRDSARKSPSSPESTLFLVVDLTPSTGVVLRNHLQIPDSLVWDSLITGLQRLIAFLEARANTSGYHLHVFWTDGTRFLPAGTAPDTFLPAPRGTPVVRLWQSARALPGRVLIFTDGIAPHIEDFSAISQVPYPPGMVLIPDSPENFCDIRVEKVQVPHQIPAHTSFEVGISVRVMGGSCPPARELPLQIEVLPAGESRIFSIPLIQTRNLNSSGTSIASGNTTAVLPGLPPGLYRLRVRLLSIVDSFPRNNSRTIPLEVVEERDTVWLVHAGWLTPDIGFFRSALSASPRFVVKVLSEDEAIRNLQDPEEWQSVRLLFIWTSEQISASLLSRILHTRIPGIWVVSGGHLPPLLQEVFSSWSVRPDPQRARWFPAGASGYPPSDWLDTLVIRAEFLPPLYRRMKVLNVSPEELWIQGQIAGIRVSLPVLACASHQPHCLLTTEGWWQWRLFLQARSPALWKPLQEWWIQLIQARISRGKPRIRIHLSASWTYPHQEVPGKITIWLPEQGFSTRGWTARLTVTPPGPEVTLTRSPTAWHFVFLASDTGWYRLHARVFPEGELDRPVGEAHAWIHVLEGNPEIPVSTVPPLFLEAIQQIGIPRMTWKEVFHLPGGLDTLWKRWIQRPPPMTSVSEPSGQRTRPSGSPASFPPLWVFLILSGTLLSEWVLRRFLFKSV